LRDAPARALTRAAAHSGAQIFAVFAQGKSLELGSIRFLTPEGCAHRFRKERDANSIERSVRRAARSAARLRRAPAAPSARDVAASRCRLAATG
jgi:hypothetical protein